MKIHEFNIIPKFNKLSNEINIKKCKFKNNFCKLLNNENKKINILKNFNIYNKNLENEKIFKKQSISDSILDLEKSSLFLEIAIKVKNKIISAYQEIMNMQI
ncbi:flagellar hook-basal body complex protein FliE [Buchnera aphidicola]|uniref:flagellar hook-basal body complex protein FliE n=1 Tax=Buchnera aphidicola TaxID=9 RepID=UPI0031B84478